MNYGPAMLMAALLCVAVSKTTAEPYKVAPPTTRSANILPPLEYDYPYQGKLTVDRVDTIEKLQEVCGISKWALGCSWARGASCRIVLVADDVIRQWGWTPELMMRHEHGHCNGWGGDHAGQRPYWEPAGKPPVKQPR